MTKIRVGDIAMRYKIEGTGPPLVMIMGFSASMEWWPPKLIAKLAEHYQVLIFDNRGAGHTDSNRCIFTIPLMAKDTLGLMDAVGIERAHILGVSMGGLIAQDIAIHYPERVRRLVLGCTACGIWKGVKLSIGRTKLWLNYLTKQDVRSRKFMTNIAFSQTYLEKNPDEIRSLGKRTRNFIMPLKNQLKQMMAVYIYDTYLKLGRITAPTLVMTGTEDYMVAPRNSDILAKRIPDARLVKFKGCGHAFVNEAEEAVATELIDFLET